VGHSGPLIGQTVGTAVEWCARAVPRAECRLETRRMDAVWAGGTTVPTDLRYSWTSKPTRAQPIDSTVSGSPD